MSMTPQEIARARYMEGRDEGYGTEPLRDSQTDADRAGNQITKLARAKDITTNKSNMGDFRSADDDPAQSR